MWARTKRNVVTDVGVRETAVVLTTTGPIRGPATDQTVMQG
jgi:hypothetical protein